MAGGINKTLLASTATKYRKELITKAILSVNEAIQHMTVLAGVQDSMLLTSLMINKLLKPYNKTWNAASTGELKPRTLQVRVGKVEFEDEQEQYRNTFLGKVGMGSVNPNTHPFERYLLEEIAKQVSEDLNLDALFDGKYNASGTNPGDVFDGFNTIIDNEIVATEISVSLGNMIATGDITSSNALDKLKLFYRGLHQTMRNRRIKLFMSHTVYDAYVDDYQTSNGSLPYNTSFDKITLEGSRNLCEIVPLSGMGTSKRLIAVPQDNIFVGTDRLSDKEMVEIVENGNPWVIAIAMKLVMGVQFGTIDKRFFAVNDQGQSSGSASS